jgi:hypothetical protein
MENDKDRAMKKWGTILGNMGMTGSRADWMSEYAQMHLDGEAGPIGEQGTTGESSFNVLPMAMKVAAKTVGFDLVSVVPMGSNTGDELDRIQAEVKAENRDRKIESVVDGKEYEEMKVQDHPDFKAGPRGELFYMDYAYAHSATSSTM